MSEEKKTMRLAKAATEFNVSVGTIVEFLATKDITIDESPNTKLGSEMLDLLEKKFQQDKMVKEKIGLTSQQEADKKAREKAKEKEEEEEKKRQEALAAAAAAEKLKKAEEEKAKQEQLKKEKLAEETSVKKVRTPKIIGKIDVEKTKPKPKTKSVKKEEKEAPVAKKKGTQTKETDIVEIPAAEPIPAPTEQPIETQPAKKEKIVELLKTNVPKLEGVKKLGKIDLDKIDTSTKPKKKTKEELRQQREQDRKEREEAIAQRKAAQLASKAKGTEKTDTAPKENRYKTEVPTLQGVTKKGKIDLPAEPSNKEGEKREKRKRIIKYELKDKFSTTPNKDENGDTNFRRKDKQHRDRRPDIKQEDVQSEVKKTLAKLGSGGKTKASKHRKERRDMMHTEKEHQQEQQALESKILKLTEFITANELANMMNIPVNKLIQTCLGIGLFVSINQRLEKDNIELLASEFGYEVNFSDSELEEEEKVEEDPQNLLPRSPIVTVMGHVDHGKTSLLDYIRKTNVIAGEAGGITQHIGAYEVQLANGKKITFLDTPGHEAFTAMRARGAKITDIAIIVIAADDAIMPQTVEAINHAQAAGVPMIFAINKIDKPGAEPDKIRTALANMNLLVEEWGGKIQSQEISAKKGLHIEELLEKVLIEAEMLELKANPNTFATGTVIESSLDKGRGYVAKILIQNGTLNKSDIVVAGTSYGKIKAMYNERNQIITSAGPSSPVLLLGLDSAPQAGDTFRVYHEEREAKMVVGKRQQLLREQGLRTQKHITLDEIGRRISVGDFQELNLIVKGDVDGSIEALSDSLLRLTTEDVQVNVIHKSVGQVTESDVLLASASNAIVIAFQVRPSQGAKKLAETEQVDVRIYSVIYDAINDLKEAIKGMKAPEIKEQIVCNVEVRKIFKASKVGTIAGCYVLDGKITKTTRVRVIRDGIVVYEGRLGSLKRIKDDVKEVTTGYECGLNIESYNDVKVGDIIEGFEQVEVKN